MFEGRLLGHAHMGMLGSTALAELEFCLDWAADQIDNPMLEDSPATTAPEA